MNQKNISAAGLAASERFQQHCLSPTAASQQYWDNWLEDNKEQEAVFKEAQDLVAKMAFIPAEAAMKEELNRFKRQMEEHPVSLHRINKRRRILQVAVACLVLLVTIGTWYNHSGKPKLALTEKTTPYGQTKEVTLSDGSQVLMNANSTLRFTNDWEEADKRELWLEGEAFFDVAHKDGQAFVVHTDQGDIRVLGTSFNVSKRQTELEVTLLEGKVQLQLSNNTKVNLQPNEQVRFANNTVDVVQADVDVVTAWRHNRMVFKNTTIKNIIARLHNDFGWQIEVKDEALLDRKINAQIPENNPKLLLEALSAIYDLRIEQNKEGHYLIE